MLSDYWWLDALFWASLFLVGYAYVGYAVALGFAARLFGKPRTLAPLSQGQAPTSFSIILAFHNEEKNLPRRLGELANLLESVRDSAGLQGEIIAVSDGSTDQSPAIARGFADRHVNLVEQIPNQGKAAGLSLGVRSARGEILVFADARQTWAPDALDRLLENFADPTVGAASGDLVLESEPGVLAGVGLYWRYEKWLRKTESRLWSQIGVTGAIAACRKSVFPKDGIPAGTLLDDVYWPLTVAMAGHRVVHDERAKAYDRLPEKTADEMRRKIRTLAGNFQLAAQLPRSLVPLVNPVWWQWISHKLLRLVVPWALLTALTASVFFRAPFFPWVLILQLIGFSLGVVGASPKLGGSSRLLNAAGAFMVLNTAAFFAFWVWICGRAGRSWRKVNYGSPDSAEVDISP